MQCVIARGWGMAPVGGGRQGDDVASPVPNFEEKLLTTTAETPNDDGPYGLVEDLTDPCQMLYTGFLVVVRRWRRGRGRLGVIRYGCVHRTA